MTNEQINKAIAEACGWTDCNEYIGKPPTHKMDQYNRSLPNYAGCLNAMHDAEEILWRIDWSNRYVFNDNLANTIMGRTVNRNEWNAETLLDATARQRAETFLRTIGKWEDEA